VVILFFRRLLFLFVLFLCFFSYSKAWATYPATTVAAWFKETSAGSNIPLAGRKFSAAISACHGYYDLNLPYAGASTSDFNSLADVDADDKRCVFGKAGQCTTCHSIYIHFANISECGANSTLSGTTCTCNTGYIQNSANQCVLPNTCTSTDDASPPFYFNVGTDPDASPPRLACHNGCFASWTGSGEVRTSLILGVRNYYSVGNYQLLGDGLVCVPGQPGQVEAGTGTQTVPASTCPEGSFPTVVEGVTKCADMATGELAEEATVVQDSQSITREYTTNVDGSTTITTTTTNNNTNTSTSSSVTYPPGAEVPSLPTSETGSSSGDGSRNGDMSSFCSENPDAGACKSTDVDPGAGADTSGLYEADPNQKTFAGSLTDFISTVEASPVYSSTAGFFSAGTFSGSCSGLSVSFSLLGTSYGFDLADYFCSPDFLPFYSYLAAGLLLMFTAIAFSIAFL